MDGTWRDLTTLSIVNEQREHMKRMLNHHSNMRIRGKETYLESDVWKVCHLIAKSKGTVTDEQGLGRTMTADEIANDILRRVFKPSIRRPTISKEESTGQADHVGWGGRNNMIQRFISLPPAVALRTRLLANAR